MGTSIAAFLQDLRVRLEQREAVPADHIHATAREAQRYMVMAAAESRWDQVSELGAEMVRVAEAIAPQRPDSGWPVVFELLGDTALDLAHHAGPREESLSLLNQESVRRIVTYLDEWRRANDVRNRFGIGNQSNLARRLKPLIAAGFVQVQDGENNSRSYRLTASGQLALQRWPPVTQHDEVEPAKVVTAEAAVKQPGPAVEGAAARQTRLPAGPMGVVEPVAQPAGV